MRTRTDTIVCRRCDRVVKTTTKPAADDEIGHGPTPCSPAFAQADCPACLPAVPDAGLFLPGFGYTQSSDPPLAWSVAITEETP